MWIKQKISRNLITTENIEEICNKYNMEQVNMKVLLKLLPLLSGAQGNY